MTQQSGKAKEISLGDDFGDVTVKVNGIRVLAYKNGRAAVCPVANDDGKAAGATPKIGDKMPDGTIYAGISPETNKPMYAMPADAPLTMAFKKATEYAAQLDAHGHQDWRLPTKAELNVLFNNRAAIGGFNLTSYGPAGWYWSASQHDACFTSGQRFGDGFQSLCHKDGHSATRCVR
jgi:hypothetical protein